MFYKNNGKRKTKNKGFHRFRTVNWEFDTVDRGRVCCDTEVELK